MPTHPGHPAIASTTLVSASRSLLNDAFDSVSLQTVTATATLNPDDGRYVLVAPASHATITLPDPASDERYQNVRLVLKRTTAGVYTATVVVAGGGLIDGSSSTTLNAQYDCEVLFSDGTAWHRLRDQTNLLAPDYLDFGDWIVGTDDSNPAPVATSDAYTAPDGTTTADELEWDNTTELADESWAEPGASVLEAGDGAEYSFYIDSEVGDGIKTVLEVEDTSVPGLLEQTTVAFSNVFAEEHVVQSQKYAGATPTGSPGDYASFGLWSDGGGSLSQSAIQDPDGGYQAWTYTATGAPREVGANFSDTALASTFSLIALPDWDTGQSWTVSWYVHADSMVTSDYYRWRVQLWQSYSSQKEGIYLSYYPSFPENPLNFTSSTSGGPGYTLAKNVRLEDAGNSWWKISVHIRDYSGLANRISWSPITSSGVGSYTIYKPEIRKGDHVSSQQLLTVDDGVENLLPPFIAEQGTISTSVFAAPDGTLTAEKYTANSTSGVLHVARVNAQAATLGDAWNPGSAWTYSIYVYPPGWSHSSMNLGVWSEGGATFTFAIATFNSSMAITSFVGSSVGVTYTAERNISVEAIGDSGWYRVSLVVHDWNADATRIRVNAPYFAIMTDPDWYYDYWSPALRYGDWVARGKNWLTNGNEGPALEDWDRIGSTLERSTVAALDGTLSAWDLTSGSASAFLRQENISGLPDGGRFQFTLYFYGIDSASASTLRLQVWQRNSGGSLSEYMRGYVNVDPDLLTLSVDNVITSGPGYTTDFLSVEAVGNNWFKWTVTWQDYGNDYNYAQFELSYYGSDPVTIWNPRLTVGNPADARGYFVSGPQNLLGDGSDYSSWSTGTAPQDVTVTTNQLVAPNGRLEADDITHTQGDNTYHYDTAASVLSGGETVHYVWYYKVDGTLAAGAGETVQFSIKNSGGTVIEQINWAVAYDDATPTVALGSTTTAGSGYTTDALEYVAVSNDWVRCQITLTDFGSTGQDVEVYHYGLDGATSAGATYDVSLWGSEVTTLDRTPTANELRPVSNGVVDFDAYPPEHRSLFADLEDAGDNWYKVTTKITDI